MNGIWNLYFSGYDFTSIGGFGFAQPPIDGERWLSVAEASVAEASKIVVSAAEAPPAERSRSRQHLSTSNNQK